MVRHLRNGRRLEKSRNLELNLRDVVDVAENVRGQKRVSARREEVLVNPERLARQDFCPALGGRLGGRRRGRDEGGGQGGADRETQFSRQADTLHFAGRAFWDVLDDEDVARDLEVGDTADGEL